MSPAWLIRNLVASWRGSGSVRDFAATMLWIYSSSPWFRRWGAGRDWIIAFQYPPPVGRLRLMLRSNKGADAFINGEVFFHHYYALPLAGPPATILDLGANTGLATVYFSRLFPSARLACVEPIPENLRVLTRNLALNSVKATVFPAAVDTRDGRVTMNLAQMDYGHSVAEPGVGVAGGGLEVDGLSISTLLGRLGWTRIGLLKVDIEGHEKALFSVDCDWLRAVDSICIECHGDFGQRDLELVAGRFGFDPPKRLPGIWLLSRSEAKQEESLPTAPLVPPGAHALDNESEVDQCGPDQKRG